MINAQKPSSSSAIDWNRLPDFSYPLQYMYESEFARFQFLSLQDRIAKALDGHPSRNLYQERLLGNLSRVKDEHARKQAVAKCQQLPEGRSFAILQAVNNIASQMSSGVDSYEYQVDDPFMIINDDTESLLAAQCEQDYLKNHLGNLAPVFSRDLTTMGVTAAYVSYDPISDKNVVNRINPKNIIWDTRYSSTGQERFRGFNMMISWSKLKKMLENNPNEIINLDIKAPNTPFWEQRDGKKGDNPYFMVNEKAAYDNRKIRSLNGLDVYVDGLNKLASSSQFWSAGNMDTWEFMHDLEHCYNRGYYQSFATTPEARTNGGYEGDDVELTIMFDMIRGIEYKIINRRYVISANAASYRRFINMPVKNPIDGSTRPCLQEFQLECPIIFQFEYQNNRDVAPWPTSDLMKVLDMHDELCALYAMREHVTEVVSILRVVADAGDAADLGDAFNMMGITLTEIQGDIQTLQLPYDPTMLDTQIAFYEKEIKKILHGYDEFDAMSMLGDRASAAESGMAIGAVAQGLAVHQNAIMSMYADIARQCIANRVAYSSANEFPVNGWDSGSAVTTAQMALNAIINVKPKLTKQIQERALATNALALAGNLRDILPPEATSYLISLALMGTAPRSVIKSFMRPEQPDPAAVQAAQLEGQNMANILAQNQAMYEQNPLPYEVSNVMQNNSPGEIDEIIRQMTSVETPQGEEESNVTLMSQGGISPIDMQSQEGAMTANLEAMTNELGSQLANPNGVVL